MQTIELQNLADLFFHEFVACYQRVDHGLVDDDDVRRRSQHLESIIHVVLRPKYHQLADDLEEVLLEKFNCNSYDHDSYDNFDDIPVHEFTDSDRYEPIDRYGEALHSEWLRMAKNLRESARYVNPRAVALLRKVFDPIEKDRTKDNEPVIFEVNPGDPLAVLHRARVFQSRHALRVALRSPDTQLGPPPTGMGSAGRMNARGVSVFYGANDPAVAIAEVRPPVGSVVVVAAFKVLRKLRLLDLSKLSSIDSVVMPKMFDSKANRWRNERKMFIRSLEQLLIQPVMPEHSDDGYLITQVVSDYLATHEKLMLDGVIYKSVQTTKERTSEKVEPTNVALFTKASKVNRAIAKHGCEVRAYEGRQLRDGDDRTGGDYPFISVTPEAVLKGFEWVGDLPASDATLEIDPDRIESHHVTFVHCATSPINVTVTIHEREVKPSPLNRLIQR
jgi:hypothetical protein